MDAAVMNVLNQKDKVLVIDGGSFGHRFAEIAKNYQIPADSYKIPFGAAFSKEEFEAFSGKGYTALLVNICDTSTGQLYDMDYLGDFCRRNHMLLIADAVSAYLVDPFDMEKQGIDVLLTASQKALALSPGVALVALSQRAIARASENSPAYYFNFMNYLENQKRGQPPFTSAVGTMLALHQRLSDIDRRGIGDEHRIHGERAAYFRNRLKELPLKVPEIPLSNSCTPVLFPEKNATEIFTKLKDKHGLVLTPSGGDWKDLQLRVGHLGNLSLEDYDLLLEKLKEEL